METLGLPSCPGLDQPALRRPNRDWPAKDSHGRSQPVPLCRPVIASLGRPSCQATVSQPPLRTGPDWPCETGFRDLCQQVTLYVLWEMCLLEGSKGCLGLDEGETNSKPPFRPTCHDNRETLPPLNDYESFLKEDRSFCDGARKFGEGVVASTRNAAASRHSKCTGHSGTLSLASGYVSSMGFALATWVAILGTRLVVARRRRVATNSTPPVCDDSVCKGKSKEFDELLHSKTMRREPQKVIPSNVKTKRPNQKRRSSSTLSDSSIITGSPKVKTPDWMFRSP
ncbi:hypothetical protein HPB50_003110 [Hyalomma asiaticum]|uniref:Uncharacterized protein n=1 Tax=Hyalomma asiaticum TaxID=266040 RepID=A0ACB7TBW9_HYAAI|nr:hypothetical protein HPB50_003110 [Hyalomma asiaticum]